MSIRDRFKTGLGHLAEVLFPQVVRELESGSNTARFSKVKKLILHARIQSAKHAGDVGQGEDALHQYWQTDFAHDFYDRYQHRFEKWFLGTHYPLIEALITHAQSRNITRVVEVGCGDGRVLAHLEKVMSHVDEFIGLDINPRIIQENKLRFKQDTKLQFVSGNAAVWLKENLQPSTILLTYGGVFEYFSEESLSELLGLHADQSNCAVALVEPIDPDHDLANNNNSYMFGQESSFSHNYRYLLEKAGFQVGFDDEAKTGKIRWNMLLASVE